MKIKLTHKIMALILLSTLGSGCAMVVVASYAVSAELERQQKDETERCIGLLETSFAGRVAGASATHPAEGVAGRMIAPPLDRFHDDAIVDDNVKLLGGTASIFGFDKATNNFMRRATSIKDDRGHRALGTPLASDSPAQSPLRQGRTYFGPTVIFGQPYYAIYEPTFDAQDQVNGALYAGYPMTRIYYDGYHNIMWQMGLAALVFTVLFMVVVTVSTHHLFAPLLAITGRIQGLIQGDLQSPLPEFKRRDEIGDMAAAVTMFQQALQTNREADEASRERSLNDVRRADMIVQATHSFEATAVGLMHGLSASVDAMDLAANAVAKSSHDTQTEASVVWDAAQDTTKVFDSVTKAAQHLSQSAAAIADEMRMTSAVASSALREATSTNDQVAMLVAAAQEIGGAAHLIEEIAQQTNLLALNATIEAANAGDAGRGFAVVAGEVKFLAKRTAETTDLIKHQIQMIQDTSVRTAERIVAIKATLDHMNSISASVAAAMVEQGQSSHKIAAALATATDQALIVLRSIGQVSGTAVANGEHASELRNKAAHHGEQASRLSGFITMFVGQMRQTA